MRPAYLAPLAAVLLAASPVRAQSAPPTPSTTTTPADPPSPRPPRPDPPHAAVHLVYTQRPGPNACSDEAGVRLAVRKELGYDPFVDGAPQRLTVNIGRADGEFVAEMEMRNASGTVLWTSTNIRTPSCASFLRGVGLGLAIRLERQPGPRPCPACPPAPVCAAPTECPPSAPPVVVSAEAAKSEALPRGPTFLVGAGVLLGVEVPLAVAAGVSVFGGVRWPNVSLTVEARVVLPGAGDKQGLDIHPFLFAGVTALCGHYHWLFGCGLVELGGLYLTGPDAPPGRRALFSASAGTRAGVELPLTERLAVRAQADLLGNLVPELLQVGVHLWRAPRIVGAAGLGLSLRF